jgi:hypothetical protein
MLQQVITVPFRVKILSHNFPAASEGTHISISRIAGLQEILKPESSPVIHKAGTRQRSVKFPHDKE